jgi:phage gpG-like protein
MSGLGKLAAKFRALAETPHLVVKDAAESIHKSVAAEFDGGNDPYGRAWKPLKKGGSSRLEETGAMKNSLQVLPVGTSIEISFSDYKFAFHQATRPMLSVGVMPPSWSEAIENAFAKAIKETK